MLPRSIRPKACGRPEPFRRPRVPMLALALALACAATAAQSAAPAPADPYNPKPAADDVVLPMPCGASMAFRRVMIPSEGPLGDRLVFIGATDATYGYAESLRPEHIAGSFGGDGKERWYLLGKYEVSQGQYQALSGSCPAPSADLALPQTDVGWIDAINFADRYSLWLRHNAADKLPKEDGEAGLRPAADGGRVGVRRARRHQPSPTSAFRERTFPMPDGMAAYVWFAGSASANNKVQRIGLLKPNPLGLHDMLGNVDEIVLDPFRLNKLDRLHGQAGGFVVRGGNFTTAEEDIRSAYRHEIPFYRGNEPRRAKTTGFRVALVAPVITSRARLQAIEEAWAAARQRSEGGGREAGSAEGTGAGRQAAR